MMGGDIGVNSSAGKGSTFWCHVKANDPNTNAAHNQCVPINLKEKRIVIIDTLPEAAEAIRVCFSKKLLAA